MFSHKTDRIDARLLPSRTLRSPRREAAVFARRTIGWLAVLSLALLAGGKSARAEMISWFTPSGATTIEGDDVDARADFTIADGTITVALWNFLENPVSSGQLVSGVKFDVSGAIGAGSLTTLNSGDTSVIDTDDGSYTAGVSDALTRWTATESGTTIELTTLSGRKPNRQIIGPDDNGGFDPTVGAYTNANPSISVHNPNVLGTASFTITIPGVTSESEISNVVFEFGTDPQFINGAPEPSTLVGLLSAGFIGLAAMLWRRRLHVGRIS